MGSKAKLQQGASTRSVITGTFLIGLLVLACIFMWRPLKDEMAHEDIRLSSILLKNWDSSGRIGSNSGGGGGRSRHRSSSTRLLAVPGCETAQRPKVALLTLVAGFHQERLRNSYWVAVANRRAYSIEHGFPLYIVPHGLGSGEHIAWEKFIAVKGVFQHSCAEWVWMSDADAFVMNLGLSVQQLTEDPLKHHNPREYCNSSSPDILVAGACRARMNTGSVIWRNTEWTQQYVADAWHSKHKARPVNWWDQAAMLHLYKQPEVKAHHCVVMQRALNAYPHPSDCHDGSGTFKEGDLMVHFPGGMKYLITKPDSAWLHSVPIIPSKNKDRSAQLFVISAFQDQRLDVGRKVYVPLESKYAGEGNMSTGINIFIKPQTEGFKNWGWPIHHAPIVELIATKEQ